MLHYAVGGDRANTTTKVNVSWPPETSGTGFAIHGMYIFVDIFCFRKSTGKLVEIRNHKVQDINNKIFSYTAVVVDVDEARKRKFSPKGEEIEPHTAIDQVYIKGYLTLGNQFIVIIMRTNYPGRDKSEDPDKLKIDELTNLLGGKSLAADFSDPILAPKLHPSVNSRFEFWGNADYMKPMDFKIGCRVKLKTKGFSPLIDVCSVVKENSTGNYSGENVLGGWTAKINAAPVEENARKPLPGEDKEGVDEAEWD
jgi:hypothetical protein